MLQPLVYTEISARGGADIWIIFCEKLEVFEVFADSADSSNYSTGQGKYAFREGKARNKAYNKSRK